MLTIHYSKLPLQCRHCTKLKCRKMTKEGIGEYICMKVPNFEKNKEEKCPHMSDK